MKKEELIKKIDKIIDLYLKLIEATDRANEVGCLDIGGPLFDAVFHMFEGMLVLLEEHLDCSDWLNWYIYENNCGERQMEAKSANMKECKKICNTKDLVELILDKNDNGN